MTETPEITTSTQAPKQAARVSRLYNKWVVEAVRVILGAVFIFSGFTKAIDPWGFIFKIDEYLAAMGMSLPRTVVLVGAIAISAAEFMSGFFLVTGCYKRGAVRLMGLMMAFMVPLTLWTWIADPVADCGCFGEFVTLSNAATFWKNVAISLGVAYLWIFNFKLKWALYRPMIQWMVAVVTFFYIVFIALYGYNIQPMLDFRPYPEGVNLAEILDDEADGDVRSVVSFIYERNGEQRTFPMDALPDSTWTYVDRIDTEVIDPSIGFAVFDTDDNDVTDEVVPAAGPFMLFVIPETDRFDISGSYTANEFDKAVRRAGGSSAALIAGSEEGLRRWQDLSMASYPCYSVDDTPLKQLARGTISAIYIEDGKIVWKLPLTTFDFHTVDALNSHDNPVDLASLKIDHRRVLRIATLSALGFLIFLALFQQFIIGIWRKAKK